MEETIMNTEMEEITPFEEVDAEIIEEETRLDMQSDVVKFGLVGVAAAVAIGGLVVVGKKFVAPKLGSVKEKIADWNDNRRETKLSKKEEKLRKREENYIHFEVVENSDE